MKGLAVAEFALKVLQSAPAIIQGATTLAAGLEQVNRYTVRLKAMIEEDRGPSPEEWDELNAEIKSLEDRLNSPT